MRVSFLGVGEAFGASANTSLLVDRRLLLECGPHTLLQLRRLGVGPDEVELVYISHLHGDHFLGLPALLLAFREDGRRKALTLLGPGELENVTEELLHISYGKSLGELPYKVRFLRAGDELGFMNYRLSFAPTRHSVPAMAISVAGKKKLTYACDGAPTEELVGLASQADLLVAEGYGGGAATHSSPLLAAQLARRAKVRRLALVHLWRGLAEEELERAREVFENLFVPADLETLEI
ncbi:MBL fold metallo-hydrolase [Candidatus Pyrohabitans sp.]